MTENTGWKPIPLSLKILFVLFVLWIIGSLSAIPARYELGLPLLGTFVYGITAVIILLLLDVVGPGAFLFALWKRKSWGPSVAFIYIGIFIINSAVAAVTVRDQLGLPAILVPIIANIVFLLIIYIKRDYCRL